MDKQFDEQYKSLARKRRMTTYTRDSSKSLLTHLMIAGTAALAGSAANAQIVVTNVNEDIGFAPGDVSSFVSSLPGALQFNIFRIGTRSSHALSMRSQRVLPIPSSRNAYLSVKTITPFPYAFYGVVETVPFGKKWQSILLRNHHGTEEIANVFRSITRYSTGSSSSNTHTVTYSSTLPNRGTFTDGYFAFRFTDSTRNYDYDYGWIKASLTDTSLDGLNLHISSYAYDPTGAQIGMGETVAPVPEPNAALALAALSALTLGITGVKRFKALQPTRKANP